VGRRCRPAGVDRRAVGVARIDQPAARRPHRWRSSSPPDRLRRLACGFVISRDAHRDDAELVARRARRPRAPSPEEKEGGGSEPEWRGRLAAGAEAHLLC
jgi:hypothetical protein